MTLLHDFRDVKKASQDYVVDELITVVSPPSIVLRSIERYFEARGNVLDIVLPIDVADRIGFSALYAKISVRHKERPNPAIVGRYDDRLVVGFSLVGDTEALFNGRFTIRPLGTRTELQLKGHFMLPSDLLARVRSSAMFEPPNLSLTIRIFLRELKAVVEAEFATFKVACRPVVCMKATRGQRLISF